MQLVAGDFRYLAVVKSEDIRTFFHETRQKKAKFFIINDISNNFLFPSFFHQVEIENDQNNRRDVMMTYKLQQNLDNKTVKVFHRRFFS